MSKHNRYLVWCLNHDSTRDDARSVFGYDHEDAAERWALMEDCNSADYWIVNGEEAVVMVEEEGLAGAVPVKIRVNGETIARYHAVIDEAEGK